MTDSGALYRPSILELARAGNFRAIAYWINSLLGPYGIQIQAQTTRSGCLNILVDFHQPRSRERYLRLRKQLVRFICYRLWTLNSEVIRDVRIVARIAGEPTPLWRQSVRIVTPANRARLQRSQSSRSAAQRGMAWVQFQILRSIFVSRLAVAGFFLCYWMLHWELTSRAVVEQPSPTLAPVALTQEPFELSNKGQLRAAIQPGSSQTNLPSVTLTTPGQPADITIPNRFQGQIVRGITPTGAEKVVALTFDDGPWTGTTEEVLDILKQNDVKATFFWVGLQIQKNPEVARKVAAAGHAIGNHTWQHVMQDVDEIRAAEEINNTARLIYETTGMQTSLFRPPGGNLGGQLVPYAQKQNNAIALWSVESQDYYVSAPIILDNVLSNVQPGSIVLMHDGGGDRTPTIQALPQIIATLKKRGYRFVTVPQLLEIQAQQHPSARSR